MKIKNHENCNKLIIAIIVLGFLMAGLVALSYNIDTSNDPVVLTLAMQQSEGI